MAKSPINQRTAVGAPSKIAHASVGLKGESGEAAQQREARRGRVINLKYCRLDATADGTAHPEAWRMFESIIDVRVHSHECQGNIRTCQRTRYNPATGHE